MKIMKVVFQKQGLIDNDYKNYFINNLPNDIDVIFADSSNPDDICDIISDADVFVGFSITKKFISAANNLKLIQIPWTGINRFPKEELPDKFNFLISNSHSNSLAVAEHTVALTLASSKLLIARHISMTNGNWTVRSNDDYSRWIHGSTIGIIGYGAIGKKVGQIFKYGFNCKILGIKRTISSQSDEICDFIGDFTNLEQILGKSDYIILCLPLTKETNNLIDEKEFSLMKPNCTIINISRGEIINEKALYENLSKNKIAGAGIDTWYNYPKKDNLYNNYQNYPFEKLDNIVMSPHVASKISDRTNSSSQDILDNILAIYNNEIPKNQVNIELGY